MGIRQDEVEGAENDLQEHNTYSREQSIKKL